MRVRYGYDSAPALITACGADAHVGLVPSAQGYDIRNFNSSRLKTSGTWM